MDGRKRGSNVMSLVANKLHVFAVRFTVPEENVEGVKCKDLDSVSVSVYFATKTLTSVAQKRLCLSSL